GDGPPRATSRSDAVSVSAIRRGGANATADGRRRSAANAYRAATHASWNRRPIRGVVLRLGHWTKHPRPRSAIREPGISAGGEQHLEGSLPRKLGFHAPHLSNG